MAWRPHSKAYANPSAPQAWGQCDRCADVYLHSQLRPQLIYAGPRLQPINLLVCRRCWDVPNPQLKPRILPPDPLPVMNARPVNYDYIDVDWRETEDDTTRVTEDDDRRVGEDVANNREDAP